MIPIKIENFDLSQTVFPDYPRVTASSIILGADGRLILQQRDAFAPVAAGMVACLGGSVEESETLLQAAIRELQEELEIDIDPAEMVLLGVVTRLYYRRTVPSASARYFWHDRTGRVQGTTEGALAYFNSAAEALAQDNLTFSTRWALEEAIQRKLVA